jgi:hypothetical protein
MIKGKDYLEEHDVDETLQLRCILRNNCMYEGMDGALSGLGSVAETNKLRVQKAINSPRK